MYIAIATDSKKIAKEMEQELSNLCFQKNVSNHIVNMYEILEQSSFVSYSFLKSFLNVQEDSKEILEKSHIDLAKKNDQFACSLIKACADKIEKSEFNSKNLLSLKIIIGINNHDAHLVLDKPFKVYIRDSDLKKDYDLAENPDVIYDIKEDTVGEITLDLLSRLNIGVKSGSK